MRATMDEHGMITLQAENSIEAFALARWSERAAIPAADLARNEQAYWRGSMLMVKATTGREKVRR